MKFLKVFTLVLLALLVAFAALFLLLPLPGNAQVLMYHFVDTQERALQEKNVVSVESFENHMRWLKQWGFRVISMDEYYASLIGDRKPSGKEVVITFDDGNYTYYEKAYSILKSYEYSSTMFFVSENIKQEIHGSMTVSQIKSLLKEPWMTLGSHSKTHAVLTEISPQQLEDEIKGAKRELAQLFETDPKYFAYPGGILNEQVVRVAEEADYALAFTTSPAKLGGVPEGLWSLTRVKISRTSDHPFAFWFKISGLYQFFKKGSNRIDVNHYH